MKADQAKQLETAVRQRNVQAVKELLECKAAVTESIMQTESLRDLNKHQQLLPREEMQKVEKINQLLKLHSQAALAPEAPPLPPMLLLPPSTLSVIVQTTKEEKTTKEKASESMDENVDQKADQKAEQKAEQNKLKDAKREQSSLMTWDILRTRLPKFDQLPELVKGRHERMFRYIRLDGYSDDTLRAFLAELSQLHAPDGGLDTAILRAQHQEQVVVHRHDLLAKNSNCKSAHKQCVMCVFVLMKMLELDHYLMRMLIIKMLPEELSSNNMPHPAQRSLG